MDPYNPHYYVRYSFTGATLIGCIICRNAINIEWGNIYHANYCPLAKYHSDGVAVSILAKKTLVFINVNGRDFHNSNKSTQIIFI